MKLHIYLVLVLIIFHLSWTLNVRRNRKNIHPRFRPGVQVEQKLRRRTTTTKSMRLLARNHHEPAADLDAHYHNQIRAFFERQHPVQTRSRVKSGLK